MSESEGTSETDSGESDTVAYCSICGDRHSNPEFALGYSNTVCQECNKRAVNKDGETPRHGSPPGEEAAKGVADAGENPVFIDGIKCWRRYRFGGHVARRDAFVCDSIAEFYEKHHRDHDPIQVYNCPDPPGVDTDEDRLLVERYDSEMGQPRVWGLFSATSGELLAWDVMAEQEFGPFEKFLDLVQENAGSRASYKNAKTDPATLLSYFYAFGSDCSYPHVQYIAPELDRPCSGLWAIPLVGALQGLRTVDMRESLFELEYRPLEDVGCLHDQSGASSQSQLTLTEWGTQPSELGDPRTLTIRYELSSDESLNGAYEAGIEGSLAIFQEICSAASRTLFESLCPLPAIDVHVYGDQRELLTVCVTATTLQTVKWDEIKDSSNEIRDHVEICERRHYPAPEPLSEAEDLVGVNLPAPRSASVDAILAVRAYLIDHNGGRKQDILQALMPEENYPIGHNGVAAQSKGLEGTFREWWWYEVVVPGLRAFSDLEPQDESDDYWEPTQ